jgi:hypothetical protein
MPVLFNGKALIPAPFVAVSREEQTTEDGGHLGYTYPITVRGKVLADKGSPNSAGVFWASSGYPADESVPSDSRLAAVMKKQAALRNLFAAQGATFEVTGFDGTHGLLKCNPRVRRVTFPDGEGKGANWTDYSEYVIELEADCVNGSLFGDECGDGPKVARASNEWNIELLDEAKQTYRLTHAVSATGKRAYDETGALPRQAWEQARDYVLNLTGGGVGLGLVPARMAASGVLDADALQAFNYVRGQSLNELAGTFAVTESWVCYDPKGEPPAVHEQTVEQRFTLAENRTSVSVQGTVTGLEVRDNATRELLTARWDNARSKWEGYVRPFLLSVAAGSVSGVVINPTAVGATFGFNEAAGTVTYRYEFDNRPAPYTPGAVSEVVTVTNHGAADAFAQVPVLGRPYGPVLQSLGTVTAKKRSVAIEILMPPASTTFNAPAPSTAGIVLALAPRSPLGVFLEDDQESWTPATGRYSRQTTFVWE